MLIEVLLKVFLHVVSSGLFKSSCYFSLRQNVCAYLVADHLRTDPSRKLLLLLGQHAHTHRPASPISSRCAIVT
jgi:hypothetical protein